MTGAYRVVVTRNNDGLPTGLNRYVLVGTLVTDGELPEPHHAPLVVESQTPDDSAALLALLGNPTTHFEAREVVEERGVLDRETSPVDLRVCTASEMMRVLGRLVLRRFRP